MPGRQSGESKIELAVGIVGNPLRDRDNECGGEEEEEGPPVSRPCGGGGNNNRFVRTLGAAWKVSAIDISEDGLHVVFACDDIRASDPTVKLWDAVERQWSTAASNIRELHGHRDNILAVAIVTGGAETKTALTVVSGSKDHTIKLWEWESGECVKTLAGHTSWVTSIAFRVCSIPPKIEIVSGSFDSTVKLWSAGSGACRGTFEGHSKPVVSVDISASGAQIVSGSLDKTFKVAQSRSLVVVLLLATCPLLASASTFS